MLYCRYMSADFLENTKGRGANPRANNPSSRSRPDDVRQLEGSLHSGEEYSDVLITSDFSSSRLQGIVLNGCILDGASLAKSHVNGVRAHDCVLKQCDLANVSFEESTWVGSSYTSCRCLGADFGSSELRDVTFQDCVIDYASFRFARFYRVRFESCQLSNTDFQGITATDVNFVACSFDETEFSQASIKRGRIEGCSIESIRGLTGLSGVEIDMPALYALAQALASQAGIRVIED